MYLALSPLGFVLIMVSHNAAARLALAACSCSCSLQFCAVCVCGCYCFIVPMSCLLCYVWLKIQTPGSTPHFCHNQLSLPATAFVPAYCQNMQKESTRITEAQTNTSNIWAYGCSFSREQLCLYHAYIIWCDVLSDHFPCICQDVERIAKHSPW